jgi:hypothetical protein
MLKEIMEIINEWDPIGFFPMAPKDEYANEVKKIHDYIDFAQNVKIEILAKKINDIFLESFGADVYDEDIEQCTLIAKELLKGI